MALTTNFAGEPERIWNKTIRGRDDSEAISESTFQSAAITKTKQ